MLTVNGMHRNYIICTLIPLKQQRTDNGAHCSNRVIYANLIFHAFAPFQGSK